MTTPAPSTTEPANGGAPDSSQLSDTAVQPGTVTVTPTVPDGQQADGQQQWDGKVESLPPAAQKYIRDLRKEAGDNRMAGQRQQQELLRAVAKAVGMELPEDQQAPDPGKLTEQLTATQREARAVKVENAVLRSAGKHGADPEALTDSRSFLAALDKLDPAADDFAATVDAAIKTAIDANPKLKAGRAPGASGADHAGGSGEGPRKPASLEEAVALKLGT